MQGAVPRIIGPWWALVALELACELEDLECWRGGRTWLEFTINGGLFLLCLGVVVGLRAHLAPWAAPSAPKRSGRLARQEKLRQGPGKFSKPVVCVAGKGGQGCELGAGAWVTLEEGGKKLDRRGQAWQLVCVGSGAAVDTGLIGWVPAEAIVLSEE